MTSVTDIRPTIAPVSLKTALAGLDIQGFYAADSQLAQIAESPLSLRGITVSSDDCEADWLFVAIPGLKQHGIRFAHAAIEAGASIVLTDEEGRTQAFERGLGVPVIQVVDPRAIVPQLCANIYASPATRLTTMAVTGTNGKTTTRRHRITIPQRVAVRHRRNARRPHFVRGRTYDRRGPRRRTLPGGHRTVRVRRRRYRAVGTRAVPPPCRRHCLRRCRVYEPAA